ncbi:putative deacetylase LmbE-like domain-containing protein [Mariannaea sp. PMI_226]|nr:putative deacetylase LmbE-like domain-containing protein [Mariannaea sp. PMI_226]
MDQDGQRDSPLSISANITGILTFIVAIAATVYARLTYLRNSDDEYFRVKTSLSWYKTESAWLAELVSTLNSQHDGLHTHQPEYQMYTFVMDDLLNLEQRILDLVAETEAKASIGNQDDSWTLVPRSWQGGRTSVAMAWMSVRTKALELVRQRESLTARVQFMQMSMISSRLRDLESRTKWREMKMDDSSRKLEALVESQRDKINQLEEVVNRIIVQPGNGYSSRTATLKSVGLKRSGSSDLIEDSSTIGETVDYRQAERGPHEVQFDNRPEPQTTKRWCPFHNGEVSVFVADVDEIGAGGKAHGKKDKLSNVVLILFGNVWDEDGVRFVRMQWIKDKEEDFTVSRYVSTEITSLHNWWHGSTAGTSPDSRPFDVHAILMLDQHFESEVNHGERSSSRKRSAPGDSVSSSASPSSSPSLSVASPLAFLLQQLPRHRKAHIEKLFSSWPPPKTISPVATMELRLLILAVLAVVLPSAYIMTASMARPHFPMLRNKRICLVIAHPDDEAMFFAPTVLALTQPETGNHVKILCLSTGDADGLGETRKKELVKSGMALGLRSEDDVFVIDDTENFPDSMTTTWDRTEIAKLLSGAFAARANGIDPPTANIDVLITFDSHGISSHPNHISLYHGCRAFISSLTVGSPELPSPVDLYTLTTVNMARKYSSFLDAVATWLVAKPQSGDVSREASRPSTLVFFSPFTGDKSYRTAWKTMTEAHKSQMVWFRYGWITLSRYMLINDLQLENINPNTK